MTKRDDILTLARTIYGEARGESTIGQMAIACVVMNRFKSKKWFAGKTIAETCTKKWQFSCWNENDPNRAKIENLTKKALGDIYNIASKAVNGKIKDFTCGSTHYHTENVNPLWSRGQTPVLILGHHKFYNNIN